MQSDVDLFRRAGEALYGQQWQRALARALGPLHPDGPREAIDDRYVRRLAAGDKPVPAWIWSALARLLTAERQSLSGRGRALDRLVRAIDDLQDLRRAAG